MTEADLTGSSQTDVPAPSEVTPAPVATIRGRVEWIDTDGTGHYHHSTVIRWVETAEAKLFRSLDAADLFGRIPRVHYEVDYVTPVWFGDQVELELFILAVGTSSLKMSFEATMDSTLVARGSLTTVHIDESIGRPMPWPEALRRRLLEVARAG